MRKRPGITALIIFALVASALLRLGERSNAIAEELPELVSPRQETSKGPEKSLTCPAPEAPLSLLNAIQERQRTLAAREAKLSSRLKALELAEASLKEQEKRLIAAEERLAATLSIADEATEKDLKKLTAVYESMKPKSAAALFGEMAPEFAAGFLARMRSDAAGAVLAALDPEKAYKISIILAGRNANAPRN